MTDHLEAHDLLFQLTGTGVVETDMATGRLLRANRTFCELVGYSEAELGKMTYLELTRPDDRARDAAYFAVLDRGDLQSGTSLTRALHQVQFKIWQPMNPGFLLTRFTYVERTL